MGKSVYSSQSGFTLIELAVVLTVVGITLGASMVAMQPFFVQAQYNATEKRMRAISNALTFFALQYGRLPCPGSPNPAIEPFGAPRNSTATGLDTTAFCSGAATATVADRGQFIGIVPYRALGLTEDQIKDGFGNYITYATSPILTGNNTVSPRDRIHEQCRTSLWFAGMPTNINPQKARLCCPASDGLNVVLNDAAGNSQYSGTHDTTAGLYASVDTVAATTTPNSNSTLIAFILISHGPNGDGSFLENSAALKPVTTVTPVTAETENYDGDDIFISMPLTTTDDVNFFDDVVFWQTNAHLISSVGEGSCMRP